MMDFFFIVPLLALMTMLAVIVFALKSKHDVEQRKNDPNAPKSALAADASDHAKA
jgi:hypothetical protein